MLFRSKVIVEVPVQLVGEAVRDALVVTETPAIQIEAEATRIPEFIDVNIEGAVPGTQILAGDLSLPSGSALLLDVETLIVNITEQQSQASLDAELEAAEAAAGIERDEAEKPAEAGDSAAE